MTSKYFRCNIVQATKTMEQRTRKRRACNGDEQDSSNVKSGKTVDISNEPKPKSSDSAVCGQTCSQVQSCRSTVSLGMTFYDVPCSTLARKLLGQHIVRSIGTQRIKGRIVETEAYEGPEDKAAHSYQGKKTPKNEAMFMSPGTCYVYNIYGMYCCMNISSQGDGAAVLIRAIEPVEGQDLMNQGRRNKGNDSTKPLKEKDLTNGPSKLCQALHISKNDFNKLDLISSDTLWLEAGDCVDDSLVVTCPRINIGYAEDWKEKPLRFYVLGNSCVSVKDKEAENLIRNKSD